MTATNTGDFARAEREATSSAIPCIVVGVTIGATITVDVQPMQARQYDLFDGIVDIRTPLAIKEVPYGYIGGMSFAFFVPPEIGMQGVLIVTDSEVSEVAEGQVVTSRRKDPRSGYFVPTGKLKNQTFTGNPDWAEIRSTTCRVAVSRDTVHLQAGQTSLVVTGDAFDVLVGGVSLVAALKEMSAHIATLEALVHPNGMTHGTAHAHLIDSITAAAVPQRDETGA